MHKSITLAATAAGALIGGFLGMGADHPTVSIYKAPPQHGPGRKTLYTRHKSVTPLNLSAHHPRRAKLIREKGDVFYDTSEPNSRQRHRFAARMDAKIMARTDAMAMRRAKELGRKKAKRA